MRIMSPAFANGHRIPSLYTCDGDDINPELRFDGVPKGTQSLALVVDDPDSPSGNWLHWSVWNISPEVRSIAEDSVPEGGLEGETDFSEVGYGGPCPGYGEHEYRFTIIALDCWLDVAEGAPRHVLEAAMKRHILATASLAGRYQRIKKDPRAAKLKLKQLAEAKAKLKAKPKSTPKAKGKVVKKVTAAKAKSKPKTKAKPVAKPKAKVKPGVKTKTRAKQKTKVKVGAKRKR
ncbi:MAG: YbhB/YbcL family Raf kinase inhibitor-like protein [Patescibacteria group bacterium]